MDWIYYVIPLAPALLVMVGCWLASLALRDAGVADIGWGLAFIAAAWTAYGQLAGSMDAVNWRGLLIAHLVTLWGLRLALHVFLRNFGTRKAHTEDRRYAAMRERHPQNFALWSLGFIFCLQAVLAWIISLEVFAAIAVTTPFGLLDALGLAVWLFGFCFETVGDWQLLAFKMDSANKGTVLDRGLWRYTRHPNYFGETVQWWGLFLVALGGGAWWTIISPLLLTFLIIKVSGVSMLEKDLTQTKPKYRDYIRRTSAFIPMPPKPEQSDASHDAEASDA